MKKMNKTQGLSAVATMAGPQFAGQKKSSTNDKEQDSPPKIIHNISIKPALGEEIHLAVMAGRVIITARAHYENCQISVMPNKLIKFVESVRKIVKGGIKNNPVTISTWEKLGSNAPAMTIVYVEKDRYAVTTVPASSSEEISDFTEGEMQFFLQELEASAVKADMENIIQNKISVLQGATWEGA